MAGHHPHAQQPSLKSLVETLLDDDSLRSDVVLHGLVASSPDGWIDADSILSLRKVKALNVRRADLFSALRDSWLEVWRHSDGSGAVRRPSGKPLPDTAAIDAVRPKPAPKASSALGRPLVPGLRQPAAKASASSATSYRKRPPEVQSARVEADLMRRVEPTRTATQKADEPPEHSKNSERLGQLEEPELKRRKRGVADIEDIKTSRLAGRVKSMNRNSGLGRIECEEAIMQFGKIVAFDALEYRGLREGDAVTFNVTIDPRLGTPKASHIRTVSGSSLLPEVESPRLVGLVDSLPSEDEGIGYLSCADLIPQFGSEFVEVDGEELAGFAVGSSVSFEVYQEEGGVLWGCRLLPE